MYVFSCIYYVTYNLFIQNYKKFNLAIFIIILNNFIQRKTLTHPKCFISYCWQNSHDAVSKGTKQQPGSLGWMDPRILKGMLEEEGVTCWLDTEQVGQGEGLFTDIADGLKHAKMVLVCASDEVNFPLIQKISF